MITLFSESVRAPVPTPPPAVFVPKGRVLRLRGA